LLDRAEAGSPISPLLDTKGFDANQPDLISTVVGIDCQFFHG